VAQGLHRGAEQLERLLRLGLYGGPGH